MARPRDPRSTPSQRPEGNDERKEPPPVTPAAAARPGLAGTVPPPPSTSNLEELMGSIVARVAGERPELAAKLEHGVLLDVAPGKLMVGWAPGNVFGALCSTPESTALIERAASALLGSPHRVTHELESARASGRKTVSHIEAEARERRKREEYERARAHPRIAEAVEILGARLKELKLEKSS